MPVTFPVEPGSFLDEIYQEGYRQGLQEGYQWTALKTTQTLLSHRFGALSPATLEHLSASDPETLMSYVVNIIDARSLEDVFLV